MTTQGQSKKASAAEAVVNTVVGFFIAWVAQWVICWAYDIKMNNIEVTIVTFWMTVVSLVRLYVIRRMWNKEFWRRKRG